jgi:hypothetical protein
VIQWGVVSTLRLAALSFFAGALALTVIGCASGGVVDAGTRQDDLGQEADLGEVVDLDVDAPGCVPACTGTQVCRSGACIDPSVDADSDGIAAGEDCDDDNAAIGRLAERSCSSVCGVGVEPCANGIWGACTAPAACDCVEGDPPRDVPCGFCGTQQQLCLGGAWTNAGSCSSSGECAADSVEAGGGCGRCGTSSRTCGADCTWGPATCTGEGACTAGTTETDTAACACGTQSRTRTCSPTCGWGPWTAFGSCSGGGVCTPGATQAGTCDACSQQVCTSGCAWGACSLRPGNACNWVSGTNWRSCTGDLCTSASCWQYCSSSCQYNPCQNR